MRNKLYLIIILVFILLLGLSACAQPERVDVEGPDEERQLAPPDDEQTEPEQEHATEDEDIDFDSASIGAEIEGFIPGYLCIEKENYVKVEITNTSDFTWRGGGNNPVRLGYHYYHLQEDRESYDNPTRSPLPSDVAPGETVSVEVLIDNIETTGNYIIRIDPVLEGHFWFSTKGVEPVEGEAYFGPCSN